MTDFTELLPEIFQSAIVATLFVVLIAWATFWKILALYRAASRKHKVWFIVLFFVNTAGILEIIYLLIHNSRPKRA
jgi:hypothetical protein